MARRRLIEGRAELLILRQQVLAVHFGLGLGLGLGLVAVPHQNTDLHNLRHTSYESPRHGLSRYNRLRLDRLVGAEISVFEHL